MTIKEAILQTLEDLKIPVYNNEVLNHITEKKYYEFTKGKTPGATISAQLGDFVRNGDARVKRIKKSNGIYYYYLTKNEQNIGVETVSYTHLDVYKRQTLFYPKCKFKSNRYFINLIWDGFCGNRLFFKGKSDNLLRTIKITILK